MEDLQEADLGEIRVGETLSWSPPSPTPGLNNNITRREGYLQCASFPSLPPGLHFADDGSLSGVISHDRSIERPEYDVQFFAVSTAQWQSGRVARLLVRFRVTGNNVASKSEGSAVKGMEGAAAAIAAHAADATEGQVEERTQGAADNAAEDAATRAAHRALSLAFESYEQWSRQEQSHRQTIDTMTLHLSTLKMILDEHPRLGAGRFWGWLGGLHMNLHKLMENLLPECELYLGLALLFPDERVVSEAQRNLDGCLAKRQLEAAKFGWMRGMQHMLDGRWDEAERELLQAAGKKDGWGWGVNNGDIWIALGATQALRQGQQQEEHLTNSVGNIQLDEAEATLKLAAGRRADHPWTLEALEAVKKARELISSQSSDDLVQWREDFQTETHNWCRALLKQVAPKPRSDALPSTPWTHDETNSGGGIQVRTVRAETCEAPRASIKSTAARKQS